MYSQVNIKPIQTLTDLQNRSSHCLRIGGADASFRGSYRPEDEHKNEHFILGEDGTLEATTDGLNLNAEIEKMRAANNARYRKNAGVATEFILGASKEFFADKNDDEVKAWAEASMRAAEAKFEGQVFGASLHMDESTPHLHVYILPHYQKGVKERKPKEGARKRKSRRKPRVGVSHAQVIGQYGQYHDWYNEAMHAAGYTALKRGEPMEDTGKQYGELKRRKILEAERKNDYAHEVYEHVIDADIELSKEKKAFEAEKQAFEAKKAEFHEQVVQRTNDERIKSNAIEQKLNEVERKETLLKQRVAAFKSSVELATKSIKWAEGLIERTQKWFNINKEHFPANWLAKSRDEIAAIEDELTILEENMRNTETNDDEYDSGYGGGFKM